MSYPRWFTPPRNVTYYREWPAVEAPPGQLPLPLVEGTPPVTINRYRYATGREDLPYGLQDFPTRTTALYGSFDGVNKCSGETYSDLQRKEDEALARYWEARRELELSNPELLPGQVLSNPRVFHLWGDVVRAHKLLMGYNEYCG